MSGTTLLPSCHNASSHGLIANGQKHGFTFEFIRSAQAGSRFEVLRLEAVVADPVEATLVSEIEVFKGAIEK